MKLLRAAQTLLPGRKCDLYGFAAVPLLFYGIPAVAFLVFATFDTRTDAGLIWALSAAGALTYALIGYALLAALARTLGVPTRSRGDQIVASCGVGAVLSLLIIINLMPILGPVVDGQRPETSDGVGVVAVAFLLYALTRLVQHVADLARS